MAPIVAATPWSEPGHELLAQFRVRALHTNNQVNPGQRASKRFDPYWSHLKGLYGGLHFTLALLLLICVDEVPAPRSRPTTVRQGNGGLSSQNQHLLFFLLFNPLPLISSFLLLSIIAKIGILRPSPY